MEEDAGSGFTPDIAMKLARADWAGCGRQSLAGWECLTACVLSGPISWVSGSARSCLRPGTGRQESVFECTPTLGLRQAPPSEIWWLVDTTQVVTLATPPSLSLVSEVDPLTTGVPLWNPKPSRPIHADLTAAGQLSPANRMRP